MASDESDDGYGFDHHHTHQAHQPHIQPTQGQALSRLSVCSSSFTCCNDEDDDCDDGFYWDADVYMSRLSIESFDADEELSDDPKTTMSSDSDRERECYSLPATPPRRRWGAGAVVKDYASENEALAQRGAGKPRKSVRRRAAREDRSGSGMGRKDDSYWNGVSGESESGCGVMVITRPKGGRRSLCMDLEEVKACRDLGFELEHERMLEVPSRLSVSGSNLDTNSSGGNSPIANWRISSPGDDPRDVKARLKVWAQAVALVSASQTTQHSN
ncbi:uncharacterized protein LOC116204564 [Punica granatum]|nr:uncharacterized protein LOC116204564 [Punica granatum]